MKLRTKILITVSAVILVMLVLPLAALALSGELSTMGLWIFTFFLLNPLLVIALSILAGTELSKLWWVPFAIAAVFPLLFGIAIGELVWDLYVYSAIYLPLGIFTMVFTYIGIALVKRKKALSRRTKK